MHNDITVYVSVCMWVCVLFSCFLFAGPDWPWSHVNRRSFPVPLHFQSRTVPNAVFRKQQVGAKRTFICANGSIACWNHDINSNSPQNQTIEDKYQGGHCLVCNNINQLQYLAAQTHTHTHIRLIGYSKLSIGSSVSAHGCLTIHVTLPWLGHFQSKA